jgi:hypothetical protein
MMNALPINRDEVADTTVRFRFLVFSNAADSLTLAEIQSFTGDDRVVQVQPDMKKPIWAQHEAVTQFSRFASTMIAFNFGSIGNALIYMLHEDVSVALLTLRLTNVHHFSFEASTRGLTEMSHATDAILDFDSAYQELDAARMSLESVGTSVSKYGLCRRGTLPEVDACYSQIEALNSRIERAREYHFRVIKKWTAGTWT